MKDHRIEIYIKGLSSDVFYTLLFDYFCKDNSPVESIYIADVSRKIIFPDYEEDEYQYDFRVLGESENNNAPFDLSLAKLRTQSYPLQLVVFIEGVEGEEGSWPKVENIVRKIISQMELMKFEIESVIPTDFLPKSSPAPLEQEHGPQILEKQFEDKTGWDKTLVKLHDENEVALFRLDIADNFVLQIYRALASHWWWDGLNIKAQVDQDLTNPNQYNLHQTDESGEYDPLKYPLKPRKLGYMVITRVDNDNRKPVDVKLVCCWMSVFSFWKEVESRLKIEYPVLEQTQTPADLIPNSSVLPLMQPTKSETSKNIFRKSGNVWEIKFQNCKKFNLGHLAGLSYIYLLLRYPNKEIHATQLESNFGYGTNTSTQETDFEDGINIGIDPASETMDHRAKQEYKERLVELMSERSEAEEKGDSDKIIEIDKETKYIGKILKSSTGLGGKSRTMPSDNVKASQRVQKNIKAAFKMIRAKGKCPELADYLEKSISTGLNCEYKLPEKPEIFD